jgi:hypothetical protein
MISYREQKRARANGNKVAPVEDALWRRPPQMNRPRVGD